VHMKEDMLTWKVEVATLVAVVVPEGDEEVLEEDEDMGLWFITTTARSQAI